MSAVLDAGLDRHSLDHDHFVNAGLVAGLGRHSPVQDHFVGWCEETDPPFHASACSVWPVRSPYLLPVLLTIFTRPIVIFILFMPRWHT